MRIARRIMLAMTLTLGLGGCRALNTGSLAPTPKPLAVRTFDLDKFVAEHNRNAERVQSLTAKPSIGVAGRVMRARADGRLALERPRNFKLELASMGEKKADIGSNDEEFWFWVKNDKDTSIYWCNYSELDASTLAITHQPDWIIEALGLRPITPDEAAQIRIRKGLVAGTTALVFPATRSGGENYTRMMIVWTQSRRIKEHCIYAGNLQTLLAHAEVSKYKEFDLPSSESDTRQTCYLPESIKLDWKRDQLSLDVALQEVKVNEFDPARSAGLFVEPAGYERVNLAEVSRRQQRDTRTTVRQTLPPPEPRTGAKLGQPTPLPEDTTMVPRVGPAVASHPPARTTSPLEELVTAPLPVAPESDAMRAAGAIGSLTSSYPIER
jgi:hypothetical protein